MMGLSCACISKVMRVLRGSGPPTALVSESSGERGPSSPRQLAASSVLSSSVTLSWQPPSSSSEVVGYIIYWRESGSQR